MARPITDSQGDEIIALLERIATALEKLTAPALAPPVPAAPPRTNMYQCMSCGGWYMPGTTHLCSGKQPWTYPLGTSGSYAQCGNPGPNGGRCYLQKGHTSTCVYVTVMNSNG